MEKCVVYDSGTGGAWFSLELVRRKKCRQVVFYADTGNFPLGLKTEQQLYEVLSKFASFAAELEADTVFLACNTISSVYLRYWPVFRKRIGKPIMHAFSCYQRLSQMINPLILATEATVRAQVYTYFTQGRGEELAPTQLIDALQSNRTKETEHLVAALANYVKEKGFSELVLGCTHLSEIKPLLERSGISVYDPLECILDRLEGSSAFEGEPSIELHSTGPREDMLNYLSSKLGFLREEVRVDVR
ncbi:glutamate racemase [Coprothermobacteraceae bacterium]|nr:glutamate racemase [Coprothermobacteraceae bacterium]